METFSELGKLAGRGVTDAQHRLANRYRAIYHACIGVGVCAKDAALWLEAAERVEETINDGR